MTKEQKQQTVVNELADGSIIIVFKEYYSDQWHAFTKMSSVGLSAMTEDAKQKLIDAATRWHTNRKQMIADEAQRQAQAEDEQQFRYVNLVDLPADD